MKTLTIFLAHRSFFNGIASGEKTEHYVEIRQPWINRVAEQWDSILFKIGTGDNHSEVLVKYEGVTVKELINEQSGISHPVFAIHIGKILEVKKGNNG